MRKETKKLELKKLFKEFGFLKIDEEYKAELQAEYGPEFARAIQKIFKENPNLDLLFNNKPSQPPVNTPTSNNESIGIEIYNPNNTTSQNNKHRIGQIQESELGIEIYTGQAQDSETQKKEMPISEAFINDDVKKLYRNIATKTHPDKVSLKFLNDLYIKAQAAYNKNDIFTLYLICNDLDIDYEFPDTKLIEFKGRVKTMRESNATTEQTYLWAWIHEENEGIRINILKHYITTAYIKTSQ